MTNPPSKAWSGEWQHVPAGELPMWVTSHGHVKLCCVDDDAECRQLLVAFADRMAEKDPHVYATLRGVEAARSIPWVSMSLFEVPPHLTNLWDEQIERVLVLLPWPEFRHFTVPGRPLRVRIKCPGVHTVWSLEDEDVDLIETELNGQWRRRR